MIFIHTVRIVSIIKNSGISGYLKKTDPKTIISLMIRVDRVNGHRLLIIIIVSMICFFQCILQELIWSSIEDLRLVILKCSVMILSTAYMWFSICI